MRSAVYLLVLLSALTLFAGLNRPAISDSDEAFYAEAGREMVESGDWLTPHFNYQNRFQKPILFYWVVASFYTAGGVSEAAARLGAALAGLGIVLIAFACGRRWYDERVGLLAGTIVATSFGAVSAARLSLPDLPLAFFITLATWAALVASCDRPARVRRWWVLSAVAAGLGFLTKGPVALAIPALVVIVPVVLERAYRRLRPADLLVAASLFVLVAAPWYVAMTRVHGVSYLRGFFIFDNLERFATTTFNPHRPIYFYIPIVLAGMLPWSPFFALLAKPLWRTVRRRQRPPRPDLRVLWWALLPLLLFTASVGKQPRYILPMLAPLGLALAPAMRRVVSAPVDLRRPEQRHGTLPDAQPRLFRWMTALTGMVLLALAVLLWRARPLFIAQPPGRVLAGVAVLAVAAIAVLIVAASRQWRRGPLAVALAGVALVLTLRYAVIALPQLDPVEQMAGRVLAHRTAGEPVASYQVFVRNLIFYTHVQQADLYAEQDLLEFLGRPDRVLCVMPEADVAKIEARGTPRVTRLEVLRYFDAPTAKIGTLLWPDSGPRGVRTAVLVTNK